MRERLSFLINRLREHLLAKPLGACVLSVAGVFLAKLADGTWLDEVVPRISDTSLSTLLAIMASGMLVIATFAVAAMVTAYASASSSATPRSFSLVVADDLSQTALSAFIGSFIFSVVALIALKNAYFDRAGRFVLFVATLLVFAFVVFTFVRWVDRIARLGRPGNVIDTIEAAAARALNRRRAAPTLGGRPAGPGPAQGQAVPAAAVGYVEQVDIGALQTLAERIDGRIVVTALPGAFASPGRMLAVVDAGTRLLDDAEIEEVVGAFRVGGDRVFDDDPRFGLVALSEIASRALSPAVNDPGTAIDVIGTMVRLLSAWGAPAPDPEAPVHDRVEVPPLSIDDMLGDAFMAISRDGAGLLEVAIRLQKGLASLAATGEPAMRSAARRHSRLALARAEAALTLPEDLEAAREAAHWSSSYPAGPVTE